MKTTPSPGREIIQFARHILLQIFIELPKFASSESELKSNDSFLNKFSVAMKRMASFKERPQVLKDELIDKMFHAADIVSLNNSERREKLKENPLA